MSVKNGHSPSSSPSLRGRSPRVRGLASVVASRNFSILRLSQFAKPVSVVPFAPERLSITQTGLSPETIKNIAEVQRKPARKEDSVIPLFAALRMRRALHRAKGEHEQIGPRNVVDDTNANLERHLKVLSRYKLRHVDTDGDDRQLRRRLPPLMVNPHSFVYKLWQLVTLVLIIYQSIMLPFALAFKSNDTTIVDNFTSSIFALDIVVAFNTPITEDGDETEYITDRLCIASEYLRGWFFFDLLACVPFDYVLLLVNQSKSNLSVLGLLKVLRLPRLLRFVRLLHVVKIFKLRPELRRWFQYSRHANLLRLVRLVVSFLVFNHYVACVWHGLVMSERTQAGDTSTNALHPYIIAFYQSLLVVMGQNITVYEDSEYIFCILVMVVGAVLMAVVFGNVAILIANYYESQSSHQKKMEWLFASMNRMKLPYDLQNRINAYYQAMWERHGTLDGAVAAFIPELSRNLACEVELFLRMDMINRAPIFQNCSAKVVQELVMELKLQIFMPGDYIVVRGEVGNDMYFVQSGVCKVTKEVVIPPVLLPRTPTQSAHTGPHNKVASKECNESHSAQVPTVTKEIVLKVLSQGDYFGEIALLMNCKRTANVRAQVFSELCSLTREHFESISQRYLEDRRIIESFIVDKYDPNTLQAAMKQSQEVSMHSSGPGEAATAKSVGNDFLKATTKNAVDARDAMSPKETSTRENASSAEITELLTKVLQRISHLEVQLEKESNARRESEMNMRNTLSDATRRLSISSSTNLLEQVVPKHPHALKRRFVAEEPERVSQRNLEITEDLFKETANHSTEDHLFTCEQVATSEAVPVRSKLLKRRPSLKAMTNWGFVKVESSHLGMRLRQRSRIGLNISAGSGRSLDAVSSSFTNSRDSSVHSTAAMFTDTTILTQEGEPSSEQESNLGNEDSDHFDSSARSFDLPQSSINNAQ